MILLEEILREHSKAQTASIVDWIGASQKRFDELLHLFLNGEPKVVQRAGWPLSNVVILHPHFIRNKIHLLLENLQKEHLHPAVKRNTIRLLQHVPIPKKLHGEIMDACFKFILSPVAHVAVKADSLTILQNMLKTYPEIGSELKLVIEERWQYETAGFRSRAKKVLKVLDKDSSK